MLSAQSSSPHVKWHSGLSGCCEAKVGVTAVVKRGGRERAEQKGKNHAGSSKFKCKKCSLVRSSLFEASREP
jgi:hypothetical protein